MESQIKNSLAQLSEGLQKLLSERLVAISKDFEDEFTITATAFKNFQDEQLITDKGEDLKIFSNASPCNTMLYLVIVIKLIKRIDK